MHVSATSLGRLQFMTLLAVAAAATAFADGWPTYRHDARRSGITDEALEFPLAMRWTFTPVQPPAPARGGSPDEQRHSFDAAFQAVAVSNRVYFGSSANHTIVALDAASGDVAWTFFTEGPVRLAPTVADGRVYAGSDDGTAYCLDAETGDPIWVFNAAPTPQKLVGNGQMISRWPIRSGIVIADGVAYFAAGVFPGEGLYLYAVDATTGSQVWRNASYGQGGRGSISPQGYAVLDDDAVFIPTGHAPPAAFARRDGVALSATAGPAGLERHDPARSVVTSDRLFRLTGDALVSHRLETATGDPGDAVPLWRTPTPSEGCLVLAGAHLVAGGDSQVAAFDSETGHQVWTGELTGGAYGLAIADGRLYVSSDDGTITCFGVDDGEPGRLCGPTVSKDAIEAVTTAKGTSAITADAILRMTTIRTGFALVLGTDTPRLPYELAGGSEMRVLVADEDTGAVSDLRWSLDEAGVYGKRVAVVTTPLSALPFSDYFANLVVCDARENGVPTRANELLRVLRPCGGTAFIARDPAAPSGQLDGWLGDLEDLLAEQRDFGTTIVRGAEWIMITRGALPGARGWTHSNATAGNTASSDDEYLRGPLCVLWYGETGTGRSHHPLSADGRLFVRDEDAITAIDAYNGSHLWRQEIAGDRNIRNMVIGADGLYVALSNRCVRLDVRDGSQTAEYLLPDAAPAHAWNYLAHSGGRLFGSRTPHAPEGASGDDRIFAVHEESGQPLWIVEAMRIAAATICIDGNRLFFVDRTVADEDRERVMSEVPLERRVSNTGDELPADVRRIVCLDTRSGTVRWERTEYVGDCLGTGGRGGELTAMARHGILLLAAPARADSPAGAGARGDGASALRSLIAFDGRTGDVVWSEQGGHRTRPLLVGHRVVAEPRAYELKTGAAVMRPNPVSGPPDPWLFARPEGAQDSIAGAAYTLLFGSLAPSSYDLLADAGATSVGAHDGHERMTCVAANGIALKTSTRSGWALALAPQEVDEDWGTFSSSGSHIPLRTLSVNFGGAGDRRTPDRRLWMAYPRTMPAEPWTPPFPLSSRSALSSFCGDVRFDSIDETGAPWLYVSGIEGASDLHIRLHDDPNAAMQVTVRLHFAEESGVRENDRVFHVNIEGTRVLANFDIVREAGRAGTALVREFRGLRPDDTLDLSLKAVKGKPRLCALEIIREPVDPEVSDMVISAAESMPTDIELPAKFADGAPMVIATSLTSPPQHGELTPLQDRRCTYQPNAKFVGLDAFQWQAIEGGATSRSVRVTIIVKADTVKPSLESARSAGRPSQVRLLFSEELDRTTAENPLHYRINRGISVSAAELLPGRKSVLLTTSKLVEGDTYRVTVRDIFDSALTPNRIADGASVAFRFSPRPSR